MPNAVDPGAPRAAREAAAAACTAAGVDVRSAAAADLDDVIGVFTSTWGAGRSPDWPHLRAMLQAGATVLVAHDDAGPVGATYGFLGWNGGLHLHSHMNAVLPRARGRGAGVALKLAQRADCLAHGVDEMRWTFDPLIRRNARMNLVRLGAEVAEVLPDFYGELRDAISGTDHSDRFEVRWRLTSPRVRRALDRAPQPLWRGAAGFALVPDYEALRADAPEEAAHHRDAARLAFAAAVAAGLRPELDAAGDYVFTDDDPDRADGPDDDTAPGGR
ncbi:hypothetical protein ARHIZOSPH14_04860 [Agromyces rhizosphaerae]|uniref:N-acetyltransferase domain-containing protein n=1 Tax=Agromyces rhizosphaerae TaxID=88374 RepID=A0A9W6CVT5_9MICO|nr:hypothetical protein [Agromyces rhizosphaerae]GLI26244.1 hypothetical protein ARHIZOSPH14_04860 [Agromyces rhizosphaerae]